MSSSNSQNQTSEKSEILTVSHIYKLSDKDLKRVFPKENKDQRHSAQLAQLSQWGNQEGVIKKLASDSNTGIIGDERDLIRRSKKFGSNTKPLHQQASFFESFKDSLMDKTWWVVAATAILSGICGAAVNGVKGLTEGISIIVAGLLMLLITTVTDYKKDKNLVALQGLNKDENVPVIRGKFGASCTRNIWDIVVGDVIILTAGSRTPADCLILESANLKIEETLFERTEEVPATVEANKSVKQDPFLYADSLILTGSCKVLVCAVGHNSSRNYKALETEIKTDEVTPLQEKLDNIEKQFTLIAIWTSIFVFGLMTINLFIAMGMAGGEDQPDNQPGKTGVLFSKLSYQLNFVVILWMASVPEGISLAIGLSLAFSVMKMYQEKILIRKLDAPEKMGQIDEICCGKTGTITTGNMKVAEFHCEKQDPIKNSRKNTINNCELSNTAIEKIQESILYNCDTRIEMADSTYEAVGNQTEESLLRFLQDAEIPVHLLIQKKYHHTLAQLPFDSTTKRSLTAVRHPEDASLTVIYLKGAPEVVLGHSKLALKEDGEQDIENDRDSINDVVNSMAEQSLRVLSFAYAVVDTEEFEGTYLNQEEPTEVLLERALEENSSINFIYLATFGLRDSLRPKVTSSIEYAVNKAQINVRLVSGDHKITATQFALKAGIINAENINGGNAIMHADQFNDVVGDLSCLKNENGEMVYELANQEGFNNIEPHLRCLARATSSEKLKLIVGLRNMGKKVAASGDGINDIAAIQNAFVGISMGSGVPAVRENSGLVLTNDDFVANMKAIMWGRNIYQNIQRFLQFQVTVNVSALLTLAVGIPLFGQPPLTSVQLLWINLIMDVFGAIALATEPPIKNVLNGKSYGDNVTILDSHIWRQIIGVSFFNMLVMLFIFFFGRVAGNLHDYDWDTTTYVSMPDGYLTRGESNTPEQIAMFDLFEQSQAKAKHFTYIFNTFVFLQLFNMINCRKISENDFNVFESFFHNWNFLFCFVMIGGVQFAGVQYLPTIFRTVPLEKSEWGSCIIVGSSSLLFGAFVKLIPKRLFKRFKTFIKEDEKPKSRLLDLNDAMTKGAPPTASDKYQTMEQNSMDGSMSMSNKGDDENDNYNKL